MLSGRVDDENLAVLVLYPITAEEEIEREASKRLDDIALLEKSSFDEEEWQGRTYVATDNKALKRKASEMYCDVTQHHYAELYVTAEGSPEIGFCQIRTDSEFYAEEFNYWWNRVVDNLISDMESKGIKKEDMSAKMKVVIDAKRVDINPGYRLYRPGCPEYESQSYKNPVLGEAKSFKDMKDVSRDYKAIEVYDRATA